MYSTWLENNSLNNFHELIERINSFEYFYKYQQN